MHDPAYLLILASQGEVKLSVWRKLGKQLSAEPGWKCQAQSLLGGWKRGFLSPDDKLQSSNLPPFAMFLLGASAVFEDALKPASVEIVQLLEALGLIDRDGSSCALRGVRLLPLHNAWSVVPLPWKSCAPFPWTQLNYGEDTHLMLSFLNECETDGKRVLDVGTGTGVLAVQCAAKGALVSAIDVDPLALAAAQLNAALSGLEDRVWLYQQPIEMFSPGYHFDLVLCNPPLLPLLPGGFLPPTADGGPDGFVVIRSLIGRLDYILSANGIALILCRIETGEPSVPTGEELKSALPWLPAWLRLYFHERDARPLIEDLFYLCAKQYPEHLRTEAFEGLLKPHTTRHWAHYGILEISR